MQSFQPPRRVLMGPGPSDVSPRVLAALARPTIGHLDPEFQKLMEEIKTALQRLFNAPDHACVPLPAPGTAGMEAAIMNLLEPGDKVCLVLGHEERGLTQACMAACDAVAFIPMLGKIGSLNVATAAAIAMYEVRRQSWTSPAAE